MDSNSQPSAPKQSHLLWLLIQKELRETLRDRRTTVTLLLMPLLLYPMLGLGFRFIALHEAGADAPAYRVAFSTEQDATWLAETLITADSLLPPPDEPSSVPRLEVLVPNDDGEFDLDELVKQGFVDVGVNIEFDESTGNADDASASSPAANIELLQNSNSASSRDAVDYIEKRLNIVGEDWINRWAASQNLDLRRPLAYERRRITPDDTGGGILGLLPLVLLLMTVTGGVYPAIDLTAGERERNTLESLMTLPIAKFRLLFAKYVAVYSVTVLTGLMNLIAMSVTLYALQLDVSLLGSGGFTLMLALKLFLVLVAFAAFYSAVLLLLTSSARSFKEAQAYLIPLLLLSLAPGLVILLPGWDLSRTTAVIPMVNILLLSRGLLEGNAALLPAIVALASTTLYGAAALAMAAQVFGNDSASTGSRGHLSGLFARPEGPGRVPTAAMAMSGLAIVFPAYFVVSGVLSRGGDASPTYRLVLSGIMTIVLFLGVPTLLLRWQKIPLASGLGVLRPRPIFILGAGLLGLSTWPWVFQLVVWAQSIGIRGLDLSRVEEVDKLLAGWKSISTFVLVLALGVLPGICEEAFFRGYLFRGIEPTLGGKATVLVTAILFGLFHVVLAGGAAPERILPSTLMGVLLGWVAWRTGSILPSMILHTIHNSALLMIASYRDELSRWNIGALEQSSLPFFWLAVAMLGIVAGLCITHFATGGAGGASLDQDAAVTQNA